MYDAYIYSNYVEYFHKNILLVSLSHSEPIYKSEILHSVLLGHSNICKYIRKRITNGEVRIHVSSLNQILYLKKLLNVRYISDSLLFTSFPSTVCIIDDTIMPSLLKDLWPFSIVVFLWNIKKIPIKIVSKVSQYENLSSNCFAEQAP